MYTFPSSQRRLDDLVVILAPDRVRHALGSVPKHDPAQVGHLGRRGALDRRRHGVRGQIARAGAGGAGRGTNVQLRAAGDVLAPGGQTFEEPRLADVAVSVVVELDPLWDYLVSVLNLIPNVANISGIFDGP